MTLQSYIIFLIALCATLLTALGILTAIMFSRLRSRTRRPALPVPLPLPPLPDDYPKIFDDQTNQLLGRVQVGEVCERAAILQWQLTQAVFHAEWKTGADDDIPAMCSQLKQTLDTFGYDEKHFSLFSLHTTTKLLMQEDTREKILRHIISCLLIYNIGLDGGPPEFTLLDPSYIAAAKHWQPSRDAFTFWLFQRWRALSSHSYWPGLVPIPNPLLENQLEAPNQMAQARLLCLIRTTLNPIVRFTSNELDECVRLATLLGIFIQSSPSALQFSFDHPDPKSTAFSNTVPMSKNGILPNTPSLLDPGNWNGLQFKTPEPKRIRMQSEFPRTIVLFPALITLGDKHGVLFQKPTTLHAAVVFSQNPHSQDIDGSSGSDGENKRGRAT